jgi:hypothetical protein
MATSLFEVCARQKMIDDRPERGQVLFDHCLNDVEVNTEVVMNDLVAQACNLLPGDLRVL